MSVQIYRSLKGLTIKQTGKRDIDIVNVNDIEVRPFESDKVFLAFYGDGLLIDPAEVTIINNVAVSSLTQSRLIDALMGRILTDIAIDIEDSVIQNLTANTSLVLKSGRNPNITTASVPEDIINGSTPYPGFPLTAPEELQFLSDNAGDTGTVTFVYLPTSTSTEYLTGTVTLNGTTPVNSGITAYRVHTMFYNDGSTGTFNLGTITCRWATTTTVIFLTIPVGCSQSYSAVYTIPYGKTGVIKRVFCEVHDASSVSVQGALWTRLQGSSPRLRRNFACQSGSAYIDQIYGGVSLPQMTDVVLRITNCTSNSATTVVGGFDLLLINNI